MLQSEMSPESFCLTIGVHINTAFVKYREGHTPNLYFKLLLELAAHRIVITVMIRFVRRLVIEIK